MTWLLINFHSHAGFKFHGEFILVMIIFSINRQTCGASGVYRGWYKDKTKKGFASF